MTATTRRAVYAAVPLLVVAAVSLVFVLRATSQPAKAETQQAQGITWSAGEKRAPAIELRAADGSPFSLASLRGHRVIVTFVDPHCTTFCPRESIVLDQAIRALPPAQRPDIVAVSVDPTVQNEQVLVKEARRFRWAPQWRWAIGSKAQLEAVWKRYGITVLPTPDDITHTEAAYVLDARGYQRSLLLWPFKATAVSGALAAAS
jgi:cytochrome oxidase Cu insertion factor (SCO1/SenC/PrrC family)